MKTTHVVNGLGNPLCGTELKPSRMRYVDAPNEDGYPRPRTGALTIGEPTCTKCLEVIAGQR